MPQTSTVPSVGGARPSMRRKRVVLPAPLAPTSPTSPRGTSTVRPSRATVRWKRLVRADVRSNGPGGTPDMLADAGVGGVRDRANGANRALGLRFAPVRADDH